MDVSCAQAGSDTACPIDITRGHIAGEPVRRVVRDADRLLFVPVRENRQHRAEDLFASDGHVVAHIAKNRRANIVTPGQTLGSTGPSRYESCTLFDALADQSLNLFELG